MNINESWCNFSILGHEVILLNIQQTYNYSRLVLHLKMSHSAVTDYNTILQHNMTTSLYWRFLV